MNENAVLSQLGQWAVYYAKLGLRVFPVKPKGKSPPLIKDWANKATSDIETVTGWWTKHPEANIGVAMGGGLVDIETDIKDIDGQCYVGEEVLAAWIREYGEELPLIPYHKS